MAQSKEIELQVRLHLVLALQEKYVPNGVELKLRLNRSSPRFCLMAAEYPSEVKIRASTLTVIYVQLQPAIANDLTQSIAQHHAKNPIRRVEVKTFTIGN